MVVCGGGGLKVSTGKVPGVAGTFGAVYVH